MPILPPLLLKQRAELLLEASEVAEKLGKDDALRDRRRRTQADIVKTVRNRLGDFPASLYHREWITRKIDVTAIRCLETFNSVVAESYCEAFDAIGKLCEILAMDFACDDSAPVTTQVRVIMVQHAEGESFTFRSGKERRKQNRRIDSSGVPERQERRYGPQRRSGLDRRK
jgi:hypothetical protein